MAAILIIAWLVVFAPLVALPFLPKVDGPLVPMPREMTSRQVVPIAPTRYDHAA